MTFNELIDIVRIRLDDTEVPYLWSDEELFNYLVRSCQLFVSTVYAGKLSHYININAGDYSFDLSTRKPYLVDLDRVFFGRIELINRPDLDYPSTPTGQPKFYKFENNILYIHPATSSAGTIQCIFTASISTDTLNTSDEVPLDTEHQLHLVDGAMFYAYGKKDSEAYNEKRIREHFQLFSSFMETAKRDIMRRQEKYIKTNILPRGFLI